MTLPHVQAGEVARAAEQNDLISTVNGHTTAIDTAAGTLADHTSQLSEHDTRLDEHGNRIGALEAAPSGGSHAGAYFGQWTDDNRLAAGVRVDSGSGVRVIDIDYQVLTPVGCSMQSGTFTPDHAGMWMLSISVQYQGSTSVRAVYAATGNADRNPTTGKLGLLAGPSMDAQSTTAVTRLNAGQPLSIYAALWSGAAMNVWRAHGNNVTAVWLGP